MGTNFKIASTAFRGGFLFVILRSLGDMQVRFIKLSVRTLFLLIGCVTNNELTQGEIEVQNMAADAVSGILFDSNLEFSASCNIRKDGFVVIFFNDSDPENQYTQGY